ncbi:hypothetical protein OUZ56_010802 [Daphnia magna]|uniref:Uncharacterized protein n=1 Tax=Daphnia magna TaxID=35525 RepID=A0ABQ9YYJ4_9CRUS|nr:hypothetical protein OUZ56_010802 [Daphnia magna]
MKTNVGCHTGIRRRRPDTVGLVRHVTWEREVRLLTGHSPEQIGGAFNCPASSLNAHPLSVVLVQRGREPQPSPMK